MTEPTPVPPAQSRQRHFPEFLREIVYGGNDGMVTAFAVAGGFAGAASGGAAARRSLPHRGLPAARPACPARQRSEGRRRWCRPRAARPRRGITDPGSEDPALNGAATFLSFVGFGAIPLVPYFLLPPMPETFRLSVAATAAALVSLGLLRWFVTRENIVRSVGETVLIGDSCAVIAYAVGTAFRH